MHKCEMQAFIHACLHAYMYALHAHMHGLYAWVDYTLWLLQLGI